MTFGIVGNTSKPVTREVLGTLIGYCSAKRISFRVHETLGAWINAESGENVIDRSAMLGTQDLTSASDCIIALGGDGTMLATARMIAGADVPLLGINLGKLGFLAEVSVEEMLECLDEIRSGHYIVEERTAITATADRAAKTYFALNEIVVDRGASPRVIELETYVNDDFLVTYAADGIIVTTPTGSTAYSLASGGPIVAPGSAVLTVNPISPHTLTARPVIVPDVSTIKVVVHASPTDVHLTADGQDEGFYETPATFLIRKAPRSVKLVKRKSSHYFDLLRTKLLWGKDLRVGESKSGTEG